MKIGVKYTIESKEMVVSPCGKVLIMGYLEEQDLPITPVLSVAWTWEWIKQSGLYRGKLPKRLARVMRSRYGVMLTSEQVSEIGNITKEHILPPAKRLLDFDNKLNWSAGDFGDGGSCFWTCHKPARGILRENGVLAIRLHDEDGGYARAWVYKIDQDTWLLFNAYGVTTHVMANVFATFLSDETDKSWEYNGVSLSVNDDTTGLIYINACPQVVYVKDTSPTDYVSLEWDIGDYILCYHCEAYVEAGTENRYRGSSYCDACFDEAAVRCSGCGNLIDSSGEEYDYEGETLCCYCYNDRRNDRQEEEEV